MNELVKYLGIVLILLGVIVLGIYAFQSIVSNTILAVAALLLVGGAIAHVILNKIFQ